MSKVWVTIMEEEMIKPCAGGHHQIWLEIERICFEYLLLPLPACSFERDGVKLKHIKISKYPQQWSSSCKIRYAGPFVLYQLA